MVKHFFLVSLNQICSFGLDLESTCNWLFHFPILNMKDSFSLTQFNNKQRYFNFLWHYCCQTSPSPSAYCNLRNISQNILQNISQSTLYCIWTSLTVLKRVKVTSLREKCPNTEYFLLRIFSHSDWIWRDTKYLSVFSPNAGKYGPENTPYLDTFHTALVWVNICNNNHYLIRNSQVP